MARTQWALLGFIGGCWLVHSLAALPAWQHFFWLWSAMAGLVALGRHGGLPRALFSLLLGLLIGFSYTSLRAELRLSDRLDPANIDQVTRVQLRVVSLPVHDQHGWHFDARVVTSQPAGVPQKIRVRWSEPVWRGPYAVYQPSQSRLPSIQPGQLWRMALVLRPVHGHLNPGGFDYERHAFAQGIRATGKVRGTPWLLSQGPGHAPDVWVQRWRHNIRTAMQPLLDRHQYAGVLLALSLGDQSRIGPQHWEVFRRTGLSHLVAISGTHVSLIAGLGAALTAWFWRRLRWRQRPLPEQVPVQIAAGVVALALAAMYCLLAGWGIPARRTFIMLATVIGLMMARVSAVSARLLVMAAFVVILFDPWAMLFSGFWLSFGAVGVLIAAAAASGQPSARGRSGWPARLWRHLWLAAKMQWMITVALLVPLAALFNEVSLVSPLANTYAIPVVGGVVTPLALLSALCVQIPGATVIASILIDIAHRVLAVTMLPTMWLADRPLASLAIMQPSRVAMLAGLLGAAILLLPRGLPGRRLAWLCLFPALLGSASRLPQGAWEATVLDVGQASAIAVRTAQHTLLFDAGMRHHVQADDGNRIIVPFFRYRGWRTLDSLVLSHADLDHVGGVRSVLASLPVNQALASFDLSAWLEQEDKKLGSLAQPIALPETLSWCRQGQQWVVDGVLFKIIWPQEPATATTRQTSRERNSASCVLSIRGRYHSLLLPGDINAAQEQALVDKGLGLHDVVVGAHHGSRGSSSRALVKATTASHVVMQAGAWSRYGHPHPDAVERWIESGSKVWRSDYHGAVRICSCSPLLEVTSQRQVQPRYWHHRFKDDTIRPATLLRSG